MAKNPGWRHEPARHALAAKGIHTGGRCPPRGEMPTFVDRRPKVPYPLNKADRRDMFERMAAIQDQMLVVWADIDEPLQEDRWFGTAYFQHHDRVENTVEAIHDLAEECTKVDDLYQHEAVKKMNELIRLSIVLEDHGRYLETTYPEMKSSEFGGNLGAHVRNNASYVRQDAENMLQQIKKYEPRR